ncbi:hypothetical protein [Saccharothrix lopnurensis]|uniref:MFS transporter n=1 Tax=Saccharothrix lopnurensis TaxID=1670621 RepID=A0ABW1P0P3_9PSEU
MIPVPPGPRRALAWLAVSVTFAFAEVLFAPLSTAAAAAVGRAGAGERAVPALLGDPGGRRPALFTALLAAGAPVLWTTLALTSAAAVPAVRRLRRSPTLGLHTAPAPVARRPVREP